MQEKVVINAAKEFVVVADFRKDSKILGAQWKKGVPIEVLPLAFKTVQIEVETKYGGNMNLRMAKAKAGPLVTDNSNFIIDWIFEVEPKCGWAQFGLELNNIPGKVPLIFFLI